ncbi:hypothetical protein AB0M46_34410 [Dactylosporangium sp. NPDC051485]
MLATRVYRNLRLVHDVPDGFELLDDGYGIDAWPDVPLSLSG